jgi:hypothetical protein
LLPGCIFRMCAVNSLKLRSPIYPVVLGSFMCTCHY